LSTRTRQQQMEWRRDRVLELSSQGFSQTDISTVLHVNKSLVSKDITRLRNRAQENLQHHIHQTIPEEYQKAMNSLNQVLRMSWSIVGKTEDEKTRLQALALINDVNKYRTELVTNGVIVHDSLQIIQSKMEHLNGNGKDKGKRLLEEIEDNEQRNKYSTEQEEQLPTTNGVF
jgi:predicted transcriptional regulator